jgi:hypothetical protein
MEDEDLPEYPNWLVYLWFLLFGGGIVAIALIGVFWAHPCITKLNDCYEVDIMCDKMNRQYTNCYEACSYVTLNNTFCEINCERPKLDTCFVNRLTRLHNVGCEPFPKYCISTDYSVETSNMGVGWLMFFIAWSIMISLFYCCACIERHVLQLEQNRNHPVVTPVEMEGNPNIAEKYVDLEMQVEGHSSSH